MAPTLKDVARYCGVSASTVSGILGKRAHLFTDEMRKKVLDAADKLGYRPHAGARAMRTGSFGAVAVIMSTRGTVSALAPYVLDGIQTVLVEKDYHLCIARTSDEKLKAEAFLPSVMQTFFADGLIINYTMGVPPQILNTISGLRVPSIWLNIKQEYDAIRPDDKNGIKMGTDILLEKGHKRIAFVYPGPSDHYHVEDRRAGYEQAMIEAGLQPHIAYANGDSMESNFKLFNEILTAPNRPTAIVAPYGIFGLHALLYATTQLGMQVPRDLSIIVVSEPFPFGLDHGFDSIVKQNPQLGVAAGEMIMTRIAKPDEPQPAVVVPMEYVPGYTIAPPPEE